jgi:hypothetical protein
MLQKHSHFCLQPYLHHPPHDILQRILGVFLCGEP